MSNPSQPAEVRFSWNIPNVLTVMRLILTPIFVVVLFLHPHESAWRAWATVVFVIAIITDFVDGKLARHLNQVTNFGKLWDPIADKAITGCAFLGLSILGELPWWITIVVLVREWGITWLRDRLRRQGIVMPAGRGGKLKTALQSVALAIFVLWIPALPIWLQVVGWVALVGCVALTVVTGVQYLYVARRLRADQLSDSA